MFKYGIVDFVDESQVISHQKFSKNWVLFQKNLYISTLLLIMLISMFDI